MCGADFLEEGRCGFNVAVKTVYAGFFELVCLFLCEETKRAADFDADFRADTADEMQNFCEVFRISLITACGNDIEAGSACFFRFLGCFHDFFFRQEGVIVYACVVTGRLGAELAVFLAASASCIDDGAEVDASAGEFLTDLISACQKKHGVFVCRTNQCFCFFFGDFSAVKNSVCNF